MGLKTNVKAGSDPSLKQIIGKAWYDLADWLGVEQKFELAKSSAATGARG